MKKTFKGKDQWQRLQEIYVKNINLKIRSLKTFTVYPQTSHGPLEFKSGVTASSGSHL